MEKQIYITEAPHHTQDNPQPAFCRQKSAPTLLASRLGNRQPSMKHLNRLPHDSYYDDKIVRPGIHFYKNILDIEQRRANGLYSGPQLAINIPQVVLLNDSSNSLIKTEQRLVTVDPYITNETYLAQLGVDKNEKVVFPVVIHSSISGNEFNNSILMSNQIWANKVVPKSQGFICRRFVIPYAVTPNILRLYYTPLSCKINRKNSGQKMVSNNPMSEQMFKKKHRQTQSYLINPQKSASYTLTILKGKSLKQFEEMAQSLVNYLQKGFPVKIGQVVIDFVVDENKEPWLLELKGIRSKVITNIFSVGTAQQIQLLTQKNNNSQICKLCRMMFAKQDVQKLITNKLILEQTSHMRNRGIPFTLGYNLRKDGFSYVCQICFDIIVAEHSLHQVQKEFSDLLHMNSSAVEKSSDHQRNDLDGKIWEQSDIKSNKNSIPKLKSWRLFLYLEKIKYTDSAVMRRPERVNLQVKFNRYRETFSKIVSKNSHNFSQSRSRFTFSSRAQSAKVPNNRLSQILCNQDRNSGEAKVEMSQTTMASKVTGSVVHSRQNANIEKVKIMTFYTKNNQNNFFEDAELGINVTVDDQKFEGRSLTLQQLKYKDTCQRHSSQVFLFDKGLKYVNLQLTVGLVCDGDVDPDDLDLQEVSGVFYPKSTPLTCLPLPDEWMEVFTMGEEVPSRCNDLNYEEIKEDKCKLRIKNL